MTVGNSIQVMINETKNILLYGSNKQSKVKRRNYTTLIFQCSNNNLKLICIMLLLF